MTKRFTAEEENLIFEALAKPYYWLRKAESLFRAYQVLATQISIDEKPKVRQKEDGRYGLDFSNQHPRLSDPALFLLVAAVENVVKAILLERNPNYVSKGELDKKLIKHLSQNLVQDINELSEDERKLCEFGKSVLLNFGRYPVPTKVVVNRSTIGIVEPEQMFCNFYQKLVGIFEKQKPSS